MIISPRIPLELFRPIVESLLGHNGTLFALSLSCKALRAESARVLYSTFGESNADNARMQIGFLSAVVHNPRLAALVRIFHTMNVVHYREDPLWGLLTAAFKMMANLKVLHFRSFGGHPAAELLVDAPFLLDRLHWGNHSEGRDMTTVLMQQNQLLYLYLDSRHGTSFPKGCLPRLRELAGNRITLEALLPGRRVCSVSWIPELHDMAFAGGGVPHIETELGNLATLSYGGYFSRPHFGLVADYMHSLEKLELVGLLSEETMLIKRLKALRELVFSYKWGSRYLPLPRDFISRRRLVDELFSCCPTLVCIDIASEWTEIAEIWYQRWTRGKAPVRVSLNEVKCGRF